MIRGGKSVERHLCERCARQSSLAPSVPPGTSAASAIIAQAIVESGAPDAERGGPVACPACGLALSQFRNEGTLGCPGCYDAFAHKLNSLLERAHEGGTHHTGKVPKRLARERDPRRAGDGGGSGGAGASPQQIVIGLEERKRRIASIQKQLEDAVLAEQYERAAELRDELRRLAPGDEGAAGGGGAGA